MSIENLQILSGSISGLIFIGGTLSMLVKTWRTHNVDSYSLMSLVLNNFGNLLYWIYITSLPVGPIYIMHGFYTVATYLMLIWYFLYRHPPETKRSVKQIKQTVQISTLDFFAGILEKLNFRACTWMTLLHIPQKRYMPKILLSC